VHRVNTTSPCAPWSLSPPRTRGRKAEEHNHVPTPEPYPTKKSPPPSNKSSAQAPFRVLPPRRPVFSPSPSVRVTHHQRATKTEARWFYRHIAVRKCISSLEQKASTTENKAFGAFRNPGSFVHKADETNQCTKKLINNKKNPY
jgi:hypothetical protein